MKRLVILFLLFALPAEAGPLDWVKHHKRFLLMEGAAFTGAALHYKGLNDCRKRNGPESCSEGYGAAWAFFGVATGVNIIVLPAVAEGCWKDGHGKFCNIFAYGGSATQAGYGLYQGRIYEENHSDSFRTLLCH